MLLSHKTVKLSAESHTTGRALKGAAQLQLKSTNGLKAHGSIQRLAISPRLFSGQPEKMTLSALCKCEQLWQAPIYKVLGMIANICFACSGTIKIF